MAVAEVAACSCPLSLKTHPNSFGTILCSVRARSDVCTPAQRLHKGKNVTAGVPGSLVIHASYLCH